jgi:flagellar FliL protein
MPDVSVLDAAADPAGAGTAAAGKRGLSRLIVIIGAALLVIGLGAALLLTHVFGHAGAGHAKTAAAHAPSGPPHYLALDPPFVVNFQADQIVRFLQVSVEVMSHDPKALALLKENDPVVRNDLLILFGNQKYATLATPAGKEQLRADALTAIRKVLARSGGDPKEIEAVYFTSFVMQ